MTRWVTYSSGPGAPLRAGVLHEGRVHGRAGTETLLDLVGTDLTAEGRDVLAAPAEVLDEAAVVLHAPIPVPPSIRDFMAFENHAVTSLEAVGSSLAPAWYDAPAFYFTNPRAVVGTGTPVAVPPGSAAFDYELEVAVVIGREGSDIPVEQAWSHVAGVTILCDWSARDLQAHEMAVGLGPAKGKDSATTLGPWLVTPDELEPYRRGHGFDRAMRASVNGVGYSAGTLADLYWSFEEMIAYASRGTRLVPGDVLGSGTVGTGCILELSRVHGGDRYPWLVPGDEVELSVEGLGSIQHVVRAGASVPPLRQRPA
ncbi:fumarylacetoacetate (FAA) hydrolase [Pseudonocardia dioxanivorans CB1190]|uniref:Fumarylacetoacetate (FAA) hydrolase n=1 Tax=Pseudonocardia dioxanivorans (strain ATCC 55486 / DSM 44775 / JCM 13855 / CB1190) TaxID=675635 RepID=F4CLM8_PSEUX|nr:fumarylacetoacetate hydrolase family protein [Pseudonocardia dioxanivorans]AEA27081.1 fumarylacetoacetate (FAA) hydrolase [Pseudonocardia dioxanivorans CB1190]